MYIQLPYSSVRIQSFVRHHCTVSSVWWRTTIRFQDLSSESPPVGWSLSTRTIRSYLGGGPDSSRERETPQHARWAEHKRKNPKVECATRLLRLFQWGEINGISGLSTTSKFFEYCIEPIQGFFFRLYPASKSKMNLFLSKNNRWFV